MDEVFNYAQSDLIDDDVMLLDCFTQVFLWIGSQSVRFGKKIEKREKRGERHEIITNEVSEILDLPSESGPGPQCLLEYLRTHTPSIPRLNVHRTKRSDAWP